MTSTYCIYTDKEVSVEKTNLEHIIPLSLGGCHDLSIYVDKEQNSILGSHVDGKLSNDYLISCLRRHKDFRGHSGKTPETKLKKSRLTASNKPIQIIFKNNKTHFYDPIEKRELLENETSGIKFSTTIKFEKNIRMLFTAKVLLASGYFVYGQTFKDHADHNALRKLMNYGLTETDETIKDLQLGILDPFHEIPDRGQGLHGLFETICKATNSSCVMFLLCTENIIGSVGIGGQYIGTINFKAKTEHFPNSDKFRLGHVLGVQDKQLRRSSFHHMTKIIHEHFEKKPSRHHYYKNRA